MERALRSLLMGGDQRLAQRAWSLGVDTSSPITVVVAVPAVELKVGRMVNVPLGGHVALIGGYAPEAQLREQVEAARATAVVSGVARGIPQLRSEYRIARASALAIGRGGRRGLFQLGDVLHIAALTGDREVREAFVDRTVGRLLRLCTNPQLISTLFILQDEQWSPARAARSLKIHPNTVVYRRQSVERILGRRLSDGDNREHISLALWLWRIGEAPGITAEAMRPRVGTTSGQGRPRSSRRQGGA